MPHGYSQQLIFNISIFKQVLWSFLHLNLNIIGQLTLIIKQYTLHYIYISPSKLSLIVPDQHINIFFIQSIRYIINKIRLRNLCCNYVCRFLSVGV
jgi:hypothetical protein